MRMQQLALDIGLAVVPSFENFCVGANHQAAQHLGQAVSGADEDAHAPTRPPTYLWGEAGAGKTHLLASVRAAFAARGCSVGWLDATSAEPPAEFDESWSALLLDDVDRFDAVRQRAAFNWFVNAQTQRRWVLAAGAWPVADLALREDLRTRLGWGHVFALQLLGDHDRRTVLQSRAQARGMHLGDDVVEFMLRRFSRDLGSLLNLLDRLDRFSLRTARPITVPLLKAMLESDDKR